MRFVSQRSPLERGAGKLLHVRGLREEHPEVFGKVHEQEKNTDVFETETHVLIHTISDIFYEKWRKQRKRYERPR